MTAQELLAELRQRNHRRLFHACTVATFESYCTLGAYRSRAAVEAAGLQLTPQVSDPQDQAMGIWDHLFLNLFDQHGDTHRGKSVFGLNKYGPVLMEFDVECLAEFETEIRSYSLEISDATYDAASHEIDSVPGLVRETYRDTYAGSTGSEPSRRPGTRGPSACLFMADEGHGVSLTGYLRRVQLDRLPEKHAAVEEEAKRRLAEALADSDLSVPVVQRDCIDRCGCRPSYGKMRSEQVRVFFFQTNALVYAMRLPRFVPE